MRKRLRRFRRLRLGGLLIHSCRRRTFQMARFDMGAEVVPKGRSVRKLDSSNFAAMTQTLPPDLAPFTGKVVRSPRGFSYLLGSRIGGGAFGSVFECVGPFDQSFALKIFQPRNRAYDEVRSEWLKEAERLYRLRHPNIVYVFDYFESGGFFYLVLERCDHSLEDMLGRPFTNRLVVDVMRQLLFAIQYLADNEIVHNDLHGGNILFVQGDSLVCKLSDLGIAQELYGQGAVRPDLVHHRIMAPEVAAGGYTTKQSDLYQLGLLLYHMHTGKQALDFSGGYDAIVQQIHEGTPRARAEALGTPLGEIASVMLRRREEYRYTSPAQVWEDMRRLDVWKRSNPPDLPARTDTAPLLPAVRSHAPEEASSLEAASAPSHPRASAQEASPPMLSDEPPTLPPPATEPAAGDPSPGPPPLGSQPSSPKPLPPPSSPGSRKKGR